MIPTINKFFIRDQTKNLTGNPQGERAFELTGDIDSSSLPARYTIEADASNCGSVVLTLDNGTILTQCHWPPYTLNGWTGSIQLAEVAHNIRAMPYSGKDCLTGPGTAASVLFRVKPALQAASPLIGIVGGSEIPLTTGMARWKDCRVTSMRSWMTIDWNRPPSSSDFSKIRAYHMAGLGSALCCTTPHAPSSDKQCADWFHAAALSANGCVDWWELINEPNLTQYWAGTLQDCVQKVMKPAYGALKNLGQKVIGPAISEDPAKLSTMLGFGYSSYCDAVGFHPYGGSVPKHIAKVQAVRTLIGDKPLMLTEWGLYGGGSSELPATWANHFQAMLDGIRGLCQGVWYYRSVYTTAQGAAKAAVLNSDFSPRQPFYDAVKGLR